MTVDDEGADDDGVGFWRIIRWWELVDGSVGVVDSCVVTEACVGW